MERGLVAKQSVTIELSSNGAETVLSLAEDNNATEGEKKHSEENWKMMLESMKKLLKG